MGKIEHGAKVRLTQSAYFRHGETGTVERRYHDYHNVWVVRFDLDDRTVPVFESEMEVLSEEVVDDGANE